MRAVERGVVWKRKKAEIVSVGYLHFVYQVGNVGAIPSFWKGRGEKLQSDLTLRPPTLSFLMYQLVCTVLTFTVHALLPYLTQVR